MRIQPQKQGIYSAAIWSSLNQTIQEKKVDLGEIQDKAELQLSDGYLFTGSAFGAKKSIQGEVVFNTGMVGYTEALTDPSYTGQILVLTYPLSGNYGVPDLSNTKHFESNKISVAGLVVSSCCFSPSHYEMKMDLNGWLKHYGVPGIQNIDTRALTKHLLSNGTMQGSVIMNGLIPQKQSFSPAEQMIQNLKKIYPANSTKTSIPSSPSVALVNCGAKMNIERSLSTRGIDVVNVPWNHTFKKDEFDGVLISNGPGNPEEWHETINSVTMLLQQNMPLMGICLGHQILALAAGAKAEKMKYGHRGQNQPCLEDKSESPSFFLTSQNHGYQIKEDSLPSKWKVLFRNVNDGSIEGIAHKTLPFIGLQFHPEASPGPIESASLFDKFVEMVQGGKK